MMTYLSHPICCIRLMRLYIAPLGPRSLRNKWLRPLLLLQFHRNICLHDSWDEDKTSKMHKLCFSKEKKPLRLLCGVLILTERTLERCPPRARSSLWTCLRLLIYVAAREKLPISTSVIRVLSSGPRERAYIFETKVQRCFTAEAETFNN